MIATSPATQISNVANAIPLAGMLSLWSMEGLEADRVLVQRLCAWAKLAPSALAKKAELAATTILRAHRGTATTRISQPTLEKLRATFPDFPDWSRPEPDLPAAANDVDYLPVRVLPTFAGMGGGGSGEGDTETALIPRYLIEREFRGGAKDFDLINVRGDSMEPLFRHGDQLLIDRRDRNPIQPGPFALFDGDAYVVKLVERVPGKRGWYRIFSANDRYSAEEIEETDTTIMGRPVWFARRL